MGEKPPKTNLQSLFKKNCAIFVNFCCCCGNIVVAKRGAYALICGQVFVAGLFFF